MADELVNSAAIAPDTTAAESNDGGAASTDGAPAGSPLSEVMAALRQHGTPLAEMEGDDTGESTAAGTAGAAEGNEGAEVSAGEGAGDPQIAPISAEGEAADASPQAAADELAAGDAAAVAADGKEPPMRAWMKSLAASQRAQVLGVIEFMRENPAVSLAEAAAAIGFKLPAGTPGAEGQAAGAEGTKAVVAQAPALEALRAEIATLDAQAEAAIGQEYDPAKARKLDKQIAEKQRELDRLERDAASAEAQVRQGAAAEYQAGLEQSAARARTAYPDAYTEGSPLYGAVADEVARLQRVNPAAFHDPEWVEAVVAKAAVKLGVTPAKTAADETGNRKAETGKGGALPANGTKPANGVKPSVPASKPPVAPKPPAIPAGGRPATPVSGTAGAAPTPAGPTPPPASAPLKEQMAYLRQQGQQVKDLVQAEA